MYPPVRVTAPAGPPVTLQEVKQHLRLVAGAETYTVEDAILQVYLDAAIAYLDGYSGVLGRCMVTQTWRQDFDDWSQCPRLPLLAAAISSVKYRKADSTLATVTSTDYSLKADDLGSYVRFGDDFSFPADLAESQAILIEFTAGFGAAADVPAALKAAILLLVAHWYVNRETVVTGTIATALPMAVDALIAPYRRVGI